MRFITREGCRWASKAALVYSWGSGCVCQQEQHACREWLLKLPDSNCEHVLLGPAGLWFNCAVRFNCRRLTR